MRRCIPEDRTLCNHCYECLRSDTKETARGKCSKGGDEGNCKEDGRILKAVSSGNHCNLNFGSTGIMQVKYKGNPVPGRGGSWGCETSRLPHFLDNRLTDGGEVVTASHAARPLTPAGFLVLISVRDSVEPSHTVWLEAIRQLKNPMTSSGIEPATFLACSIVRQPITLPHSPAIIQGNFKIRIVPLL
jgi:hypothetical protein